MSRSVELSREDYARLQRAAEEEGVTPPEWVARHLPACPEAQPCTNGKPAQTIAGVLARQVGPFRGSNVQPSSDEAGESFPEDRQQKHCAEQSGAPAAGTSRMLEVPEPIYAAIAEEAGARGLTPLTWIIGQLSARPPAPAPNGVKPKTMAERLAGRVGLLSGSKGLPGSDGVAQSFAAHLEAKQREGRL